LKRSEKIHDPLANGPVKDTSIAADQSDSVANLSSPRTASNLNARVSDLSVTDRDFRWINTGDKVEIVSERVFFLGRTDGAINVGVNKIFPERIELILQQVDGVAAVMVRGRVSSIAGNLVEAYVTLNQSISDQVTMVASIRSHCKAFLSLHERPAFIHIVNDLPITESGKIKRLSSR